MCFFFNKMVIITIIVYCTLFFVFQVQGESRLVGGSKVPPGFGRFHASLQNLTGYHVCGGAIISHRHVVTAAHCVLGVDPDYIKIVVGTIDLDTGGLQYDVESIHVHHNYNTSARVHDIAVIKVTDLFDLLYAEMIRMDEESLREGDTVLLTGFGAKKKHGVSSRRMQSLEVPVFSQDVCRYAMRNSRKVYDTMFCTFTTVGQGTCHGDSGGPLIKDNKLVGLVSWGIPCAVGYPDVHTRIVFYIDWIRHILDETSPKCVCKS